MMELDPAAKKRKEIVNFEVTCPIGIDGKICKAGEVVQIERGLADRFVVREKGEIVEKGAKKADKKAD